MFLEKLIKKFLCELNFLYEKAKRDEVHMHQFSEFIDHQMRKVLFDRDLDFEHPHKFSSNFFQSELLQKRTVKSEKKPPLCKTAKDIDMKNLTQNLPFLSKYSHALNESNYFSIQYLQSMHNKSQLSNKLRAPPLADKSTSQQNTSSNTNNRAPSDRLNLTKSMIRGMGLKGTKKGTLPSQRSKALLNVQSVLS